MAGERRDDAMTGSMEALDAELARLLDVQPSGEFAARVRQRVRTAPRRAPWSFTFPLAAAAAAVAALTFVYFAHVAKVPAPEQRALQARADVALPPPPPVVVPGERRPVTPPRDVARRVRAIPSTAVVIVDPAQRIALNRMIRLAQEGKIDSTMLEPPPPTVLPIEADVQVAPLTVHPLEIPPIPGARTDQK